MILLFIDVLERLIAWLKSFTDKTAPTLNLVNKVARSALFSRTTDMITNAVTDADVKARFTQLVNNPHINVAPKQNGTVTNPEGAVIIGPVAAGVPVWGAMFDEFQANGSYQVNNL